MESRLRKPRWLPRLWFSVLAGSSPAARVFDGKLFTEAASNYAPASERFGLKAELLAQAIWAMANCAWNLEGEDAVPGHSRPEQEPFSADSFVKQLCRSADCCHSRFQTRSRAVQASRLFWRLVSRLDPPRTRSFGLEVASRSTLNPRPAF